MRAMFGRLGDRLKRGRAGAILGVGVAALAVGLGVRKLWRWNRQRKTHPRFPAEATPTIPSMETKSPS